MPDEDHEQIQEFNRLYCVKDRTGSWGHYIASDLLYYLCSLLHTCQGPSFSGSWLGRGRSLTAAAREPSQTGDLCELELAGMFVRTLMRNNSSATWTQVQGLAFSLVSGGVRWTITVLSPVLFQKRYSGGKVFRALHKTHQEVVRSPAERPTNSGLLRERERKANELCAGEPKSGDGKARDTSLSARDPRS